MTDKKTLWNEAGIAALVLGAVPMAYLYLSGIVGSVVSVFLWLVKFVACIWLMYFFLKKFGEKHTEADRSDIFRFGMITALLSALLYSAFSLADMLFINPDSISEAIDTALENYSSMMDDNAREEIDRILPKIPAISFFTSLIYCWLFGTVLSAIFSRNIRPDNPFENNSNPDEQ